jgi:hypothetical protein
VKDFTKETDARIIIDDMLRQARWDPADKSQVLIEVTVYGKGTEKSFVDVREGAGKNKAFVTTSGGDYLPSGRADYVLYSQNGRPLAVVKDLSGLEDLVLERTERTLTGDGLASCSATIMPEGTVLLSSRAPIGLVAIAGVSMCTNQGFKSLVCEAGTDSWYLFAWCKLRNSYLQSLGRGATFTEVSKPIVESIMLPLPPIEMQQEFRKRIHRLRAIHGQRRRAFHQLETTFQIPLRRAFTGDLTAKWREAHMKELLQEMEAQSRVLNLEKV